AALTAPHGAWGISCGAEWLAREKIAVHGMTPLHWDAEENQLEEIRNLNRLLAAHPAFHGGAALRVVTQGSEPALALMRTEAGGAFALVLVNLDASAPTVVRWAAADTPPLPKSSTPLFRTGHSGAATGKIRTQGGQHSLALAPGEVICLGTPPPNAQDVLNIAEHGATAHAEPLTHWQWPRDRRRNVVWPEGTALSIEAPVRFEVRLEIDNTVRHRILAGQVRGGWQAVIPEKGIPAGPVVLRLFVHEDGGTVRTSHGVLRCAGLPRIRLAAGRTDPDACAILSNPHGAMCLARAAWGRIESQYDTLLGANLHPAHPVDRRMLLGRVRAWLVRRGYSSELTLESLESFTIQLPREAQWKFSLAAGDGHYIDLTARLLLAENDNAIAIEFTRGTDSAGEVSLILRPDIEDRGFHEKSRFSAGINFLAKGAESGAAFAAQWLHEGGWLRMELSGGTSAAWHQEPETVEVGHALDAERGLGGSAELFSPGWFGTRLHPGQSAVFQAGVTVTAQTPLSFVPSPAAVLPESVSLAEAARTSLRQFIVKRDQSLTIIAGYPWFLDWGRDTLICLRGIIAAGWLAEAREILKTFAAFERRGTLPNMIRGADDSNRDTVDAPLWFFVAAKELLDAEGNDAFLHEPAGDRTILEVLRSIAAHYAAGTPNGIRMDTASGLIFSPSHYTWMDTNHPPGTPRQGYPICTQAKWHFALRWLAQIDPAAAGKWSVLADLVRNSVQRLFVQPEIGLSDCLHAAPGQPAAAAQADDHLRPNQLLAVTLGLIDDPALRRAIVNACGELAVPGALRTLADRPVKVPLRIERLGWSLNDPFHPFWPTYIGDEDTRRKPAYHNGTAWPWLLPMYAEALLLVRGPEAKATAAALLGSVAPCFHAGALGHLLEIIDGGAPHAPRGCPAQAWSVSELVRVLALLENS
ncbi:MAG: glycogen debranching enzyme N-terminal domain-containing protein, partial [Verrucomicrobiales bacterium]|nr:glycogen debranching enzyme N-terminal domain-containing protein [Verrucomicrobiales bacterium]